MVSLSGTCSRDSPLLETKEGQHVIETDELQVGPLNDVEPFIIAVDQEVHDGRTVLFKANSKSVLGFCRRTNEK